MVSKYKVGQLVRIVGSPIYEQLGYGIILDIHMTNMSPKPYYQILFGVTPEWWHEAALKPAWV